MNEGSCEARFRPAGVLESASLAEGQHGLDALALGTVVFERFGFFKFGADIFFHNVRAHDSIHKSRLFKKSEMS